MLGILGEARPLFSRCFPLTVSRSSEPLAQAARSLGLPDSSLWPPPGGGGGQSSGCSQGGLSVWGLHQSTRAAVTKHDRRVLDNRSAPSPSLEAGSPRPRCRRGWLLLRPEGAWAPRQQPLPLLVAAASLWCPWACRGATPSLSSQAGVYVQMSLIIMISVTLG